MTAAAEPQSPRLYLDDLAPGRRFTNGRYALELAPSPSHERGVVSVPA